MVPFFCGMVLGILLSLVTAMVVWCIRTERRYPELRPPSGRKRTRHRDAPRTGPGL